MAADRTKAQIVQNLYGVNLEEQGRGYYIALEFLAICRGVYLTSPAELLSADAEIIEYQRKSHDFARRVAVGETVEEATLRVAIDGEETLATLQALASSLIIQVPGRRKAPSWYNTHLYPFVGQLIHYDAVERPATREGVRTRVPSIERYIFRGGGQWVYRALRTDSDSLRRNETRGGLADLVGDAPSPLGYISEAMTAHDHARERAPFADGREADINVYDRASPWPEYLRQGVNNIVKRSTIPRAKRTESIMHWAPYCLARHQLHLARTSLRSGPEIMYLDFVGGPSLLRRESQNALDEFRKDTVNAFNLKAASLREKALMEGDEELALRYERHVPSNSTGSSSSRAFFSETMAAIGALNATTGRRYFTLKPPMLEALVLAALKPGTEEEYYSFCRRLFDTMGILVDDRTAGEHHLTLDVDTNVYRRNSDAFHERLSATGLLTRYSDATSIVHGEAK